MERVWFHADASDADTMKNRPVARSRRTCSKTTTPKTPCSSAFMLITLMEALRIA